MEIIINKYATLFDASLFTPIKNLCINVKYNPEEIQDVYDKKDYDNILINQICDNIKNKLTNNEISEESELSDSKLEKLGINIGRNEYGSIDLTNRFFEYIDKNKIYFIKRIDTIYQNLRTMRSKHFLLEATENSLIYLFENICMESFYTKQNMVNNIYSIFLTPIMYRIINNMPVEIRHVLIRGLN